MAHDREHEKTKSAEEKRESGRPGGGQGRKDKVGDSGVYPASGPRPPGDAEAQGMASWGQGERGAEGYEDHGGSELTTLDDGTVVGGATAGPSGEPMARPMGWVENQDDDEQDREAKRPSPSKS